MPPYLTSFEYFDLWSFRFCKKTKLKSVIFSLVLESLTVYLLQLIITRILR